MDSRPQALRIWASICSPEFGCAEIFSCQQYPQPKSPPPPVQPSPAAPPQKAWSPRSVCFWVCHTVPPPAPSEAQRTGGLCGPTSGSAFRDGDQRTDSGRCALCVCVCVCGWVLGDGGGGHDRPVLDWPAPHGHGRGQGSVPGPVGYPKGLCRASLDWGLRRCPLQRRSCGGWGWQMHFGGQGHGAQGFFRITKYQGEGGWEGVQTPPPPLHFRKS